jgi:hypothetical protein
VSWTVKKLPRPLCWESDALDAKRPSSCRQTRTLPCPTGRPAVRDAGSASIREKLRRAYAWTRGTDNSRRLKDALQSGPCTWLHGMKSIHAKGGNKWVSMPGRPSCRLQGNTTPYPTVQVCGLKCRPPYARGSFVSGRGSTVSWFVTGWRAPRPGHKRDAGMVRRLAVPRRVPSRYHDFHSRRQTDKKRTTSPGKRSGGESG